MKLLWGIDLGGTKVEGVILKQGSKPEVICRMRMPSGWEQGYEHFIGQIIKLTDKMKSETGLKPERIGMGTPGILDPQTQTMKNCSSLCLNGMPLKRDMESKLGVPVEMANDANCLALAEAKYGIVQDVMPDAKVVFGVILGTGVGGGLVLNGKVWNGRQGIAGEWGHNVLDNEGPECYCGKKGCVERIIAGPQLEEYYRKLTGKQMLLADIVKLSEKGDEAARQTIDRLVTIFGKAISVVINIVDPDIIVVGGGVGNIDAIYTQGKEELRKYIFNNSVNTLIVKPKLGDSAGVFGAASLVE